MFRAIVIEPNGNAQSVKSKARDFEFDGGMYNGPKVGQINTMRLGLFTKMRYATYTKGNPNAWTLADEDAKPGAFTAADVLSTKGRYLSNVVREAMEDESKTSLLLYIAIGTSVLSILISGIGAYLIYKVANSIGLV